MKNGSGELETMIVGLKKVLFCARKKWVEKRRRMENSAGVEAVVFWLRQDRRQLCSLVDMSANEGRAVRDVA